MMDKDLSKVAEKLERIGFNVEVVEIGNGRVLLAVEPTARATWRDLKVRKPRQR